MTKTFTAWPASGRTESARYGLELPRHVAISSFVPGIVYLAGAIGVRSGMIAVCGLPFNHAPVSRLVWGELAAGLDPALGPGPVATVIQDVPSILISFAPEASLVF